jgi:hypothetical protein
MSMKRKTETAAGRVASRHRTATAEWRGIRDHAQSLEYKLRNSIKKDVESVWDKAHPKMAAALEREIEQEIKRAGFTVIDLRVTAVTHFQHYDQVKWACNFSGEVKAWQIDEDGDPEMIDVEELWGAIGDAGISGGYKDKVGRKTIQFGGKDVDIDSW